MTRDWYPAEKADSLDWPDCPCCQSGETTVVPKTGEWTCQDCGHQWHSDEMDADGNDEEIPNAITSMVEQIADVAVDEGDSR